jgi:hypothetical protein
VTLAALIAAYHDSDEPGGGLRATLPLAGRTLVERQARLAAAAGANPIVIFVERVPPALVAAIGRLRGEGIPVILARGVADAAEAIGPKDRLLMIADGLVADENQVTRLVAAGGSVLLTLPDLGADERFERIDAQSRWAGLAVTDGQMLKQTAAMLRDWDLQSTLLRRVVQSGARQFSVRGDVVGAELTIAETSADLALVQSHIVQRASIASRDDWVSRFLLAPIEQAATRLLIPAAVKPEWLCLGAAILTAAAAIAFAKQWFWPGMLLALLATPLDGIAERLAALRMQTRSASGWVGEWLPGLAGAALLALGYALAAVQGWGCELLAIVTILFLLAMRGEDKGRAVEGGAFLAERKGMTWLMLPFAIAGLWVSGLAALALYAAASFFWVQRQAHPRISAPVKD